MAATTDVPIVIDPDAAARVAELGMESALQEMLDHAKRTLPRLHRLHVEVDYREHMGEESALTIWAHREEPPDGIEDSAARTYGHWMIDTFSPHVKRWFALLSIYEAPNGR
jgi:hypothetical protein